MASRRAVGDVRPSQVITSFGPGAVVDLQTMSIIVAGIDRWPRNPEDAIHERRLQRALRVDSFFSAKPSEGSFYNRRGTVPGYIFPRFQVCPVESCRTLSSLTEGLSRVRRPREGVRLQSPRMQRSERWEKACADHAGSIHRRVR